MNKYVIASYIYGNGKILEGRVNNGFTVAADEAVKIVSPISDTSDPPDTSIPLHQHFLSLFTTESVVNPAEQLLCFFDLFHLIFGRK